MKNAREKRLKKIIIDLVMDLHKRMFIYFRNILDRAHFQRSC